jgi:hypothetical protein
VKLKAMSDDPRASLGMKLIVALHWIFGFMGMLALWLQLTEVSYLPAGLRVLMSTVTAFDVALLFFLGAGLLTMKKRWIDAVLVISIVSLIAFYIVPLRPALPLEVVVILYLVSQRGGISVKQLKHLLPVGLLAILTSQNLAVSPHFFFQPRGTLIEYHEVVSDKGGVWALIEVYKEADAVPTADFYGLEATIRCSDRKFDRLVVNASALVPEAEACDWSPQTAPGAVLHLGLGVSTFSIGSSRIVAIQFGANENSLVWHESLLMPAREAVFSIQYFVPEGTHFTMSLTAEVGLDHEIFGNLWTETLAFTNTA